MIKTTVLIFALIFSMIVRGQDTTSFWLTFNHLAVSVKDNGLLHALKIRL